MDLSLSELFPSNISSLFKIQMDSFCLPQSGDFCSHCNTYNSDHTQGTIQIQQSLELGHSFVLGDRYTHLFNLHNRGSPLQMGYLLPRFSLPRCFGLGVSRLMGAIFELFGHNSGILFPDRITTFDVVLLNAGGFVIGV